jgi:hypothetical protein
LPPPPPPPPESLLASGALSDIVLNRFLQLKKLSSSAQAAVDTGAKRPGKCIGFVSLQAAQTADDTEITSALPLTSEIANILDIFFPILFDTFYLVSKVNSKCFVKISPQF